MLNLPEDEKLKKGLSSLKMGQILNFFNLKKHKETSLYSLFQLNNLQVYIYKEEGNIAAFSNDIFQKLNHENLFFLLSPLLNPTLEIIAEIKQISVYEKFESLEEISFEKLIDRLFGLKKITHASAANFSSQFFNIAHLIQPPFENKFFTSGQEDCLQFIRFEKKTIVDIVRIYPQQNDSFFGKSNGIWSIDFNSAHKDILIFYNPVSLSRYYTERLPGKEFIILIDKEYSLGSILTIFKFFQEKKFEKFIFPAFTIDEELFFLKVFLDFINYASNTPRQYNLKPVKTGRIYELSFSISSTNYNIAKEGQYYSNLLNVPGHSSSLNFTKSFKFGSPYRKVFTFQFFLKKDLIRHYVKVISEMEGVSEIIKYEYFN